ncbi:MAG: cation transporter [Bdellovibrio sp.]|nr:cation transporter [Bdellovibrio sp.]
MNYDKAFLIGITLNIIFVAVEVGYGFFANSLALLADAGHNLSDVLGLIVAWIATILVRRKPNQTYTFGLRSSSILAALTNAVFLLVAIGGILWEAVGRFQDAPAVAGPTVIAVAAFGILVNGLTAYLFSSGHKDDLNIKGAYLHMLADAVVSLGVVIAGFVMIYTGWNWLDPLISVVVSLIILKGTWSLLKDSMRLAMNAVPVGISHAEVLGFLHAKKGVSKVHDLHIWGISTTENALTAHLVMPEGHPGDGFLSHLSTDLQKQFRIHHSTVQIEIGNDPNHPCALEPDEVV